MASLLRVVNGPTAKCFVHAAAPDRGKFVILITGSGVVSCSRDTVDEVFMTRRLNVTPKTTEHNLMHGDKSEIIIKDCAIVLLKLTRQTGSTRGLSATAELLVIGLCASSYSRHKARRRRRASLVLSYRINAS